MRVYFSPCGIGFGHVGRCIPIAKELEKLGAQILFSSYREGLDLLKKERLPVVEVPPIGFQVKPDGTIDFKQTTANPGPFLASFILTEQVTAEIQNIGTFRPDVVISDSRISPIIASKLLEIPCICILNQFQIFIPRKKRFLRLARFADSISLALISKIWTSGITLIPDFPLPYTISMGNLNIPKAFRKRVFLIGPILPTQPDELPDKDKLREKLDLDDRPTIFAPISGPVRERAYLIKLLEKIFSNFPEKYRIVMSLGYPDANTEPIFDDGNFRVYRWIKTNERYEYLKACDLVVSRAGHGTISNTICYGKPMVLIPTPSHTEQLNNAKRVVEIGTAKVIKQDYLNKDILLKAVEKTLQDEMKNRAEKVQKEVSKLNGIKRVVEIILNVGEGNKNVLTS